ncbi:hypothetical protein SS50377_22160 [Spironucleus salmonicida]|uniref:LSM domain-containing protein n=1 Tax=Spironucleus salmonicida TaxID=348837 RepID=V6LM08_9EUKA|nr:hypothetical protein SS50377_22160 [Spironucleus salmonicida]|eukprot:EST45680.1 Hypothetical protein SS50377_14253 [Spironucleus salmonicida]
MQPDQYLQQSTGEAVFVTTNTTSISGILQAYTPVSIVMVNCITSDNQVFSTIQIKKDTIVSIQFSDVCIENFTQKVEMVVKPKQQSKWKVQ